jgi:heat shock protein beta
MLEEALKDGYTQEFHADVHRVLDIIINSIYTEREIFIRELISNSSDASNKIRFMGITNDELLGEGDLRNLDIKIDLDQFNKTITFTDKGLGMTKQQLVENLGTIAKSGTSNFVEKIKEAQASNSNDMIGQFGVGFYSVFLVAEKVIVTSKSHEANEPQHIWKSDASGSFTVVQDPRGNTLGRGTSVKIYLRQDTLEFLKESRVEEVVKK